MAPFRGSTGTPRRIDLLGYCKCTCGGMKTVRGSHLREGSVKSCGCLLVARFYVHGHGANGLGTKKVSPTYSTYRNMLRRCLEPTNIGYSNYGGRGIKVCDRWQGPKGFPNFLADMSERSKGLFLERKDNDGDYTPNNCCWGTWDDECYNKRTNRLLTARGHTQALGLWARQQGLHPNTISKRINRGWTIDEAIFSANGTRRNRAA